MSSRKSRRSENRLRMILMLLSRNCSLRGIGGDGRRFEARAVDTDEGLPVAFEEEMLLEGFEGAAIVDLPELGGSQRLRDGGLKVFSLVAFDGH